MNCYTKKFRDHRHCVSGDIMVLVSHVILQNHAIKTSCEFFGQHPIKLCHYTVKFGGHRHSGSGDIKF